MFNASHNFGRSGRDPPPLPLFRCKSVWPRMTEYKRIHRFKGRRGMKKGEVRLSPLRAFPNHHLPFCRSSELIHTRRSSLSLPSPEGSSRTRLRSPSAGAELPVVQTKEQTGLSFATRSLQIRVQAKALRSRRAFASVQMRSNFVATRPGASVPPARNLHGDRDRSCSREPVASKSRIACDPGSLAPLSPNL